MNAARDDMITTANSTLIRTDTTLPKCSFLSSPTRGARAKDISTAKANGSRMGRPK